MDEEKYMPHKFALALIGIGFCFDIMAIENIAGDADQLKEKIRTAIANFEQTPREEWAYQVKRFENEEGDVTSSTERFTPNLSATKQWQLLKINGKKPTVRQHEKFVKDKQAQIKKELNGANYAMRLSSIIDEDSIEFLLDSGSHIKASFNVNISQLGLDANDKLAGTLLYNKQLNFIEKISIVNNGEFSPMLSSSIVEFTIVFNFINIGGAILPLQHTMNMKGRFAYFIEIDEVSNDTFSNFEYKGRSLR